MGSSRKRQAGLCVVVAAALLTGACTEKGLPGKNRELAEAQHREWRYPIYEALPAAAKVIPFDGHVWQMTGQMRNVPASMLQSVASVNGAELFALKSDGAPYNQLYSGTGGHYSVVARVY